MTGCDCTTTHSIEGRAGYQTRRPLPLANERNCRGRSAATRVDSGMRIRRCVQTRMKIHFRRSHANCIREAMQILGLLSFRFVGGLIAVERQQIQTLVLLTSIRHAHRAGPARRQAEKCQEDEIKQSHAKNLSTICTGVNHILTNDSDNGKMKRAVRFLRNLRMR